MIKWLDRHELPVDPKLTIAQIFAIIYQHKNKFTDFSGDKYLPNMGHTVLRLPPYYLDLNPIKIIWSQLKDYVAARNVDVICLQ